eukprot:10717226-Alexandrium_andersonii.AAC.1
MRAQDLAAGPRPAPAEGGCATRPTPRLRTNANCDVLNTTSARQNARGTRARQNRPPSTHLASSARRPTTHP